jgi:DNA (cytosine-5)-methyltransferase 1
MRPLFGAAVKSMHLFAGIGGAALGFQRAGFTPAVLCDIDPACQRTLRRHWPLAYHHGDIETLRGEHIKERINVITGGFPCQDISHARTGSGLPLGDGLDGARSGLWFEQLRLVEELQPDYVVGENVTALRHRGLDRVLASLDEIRYDAEWHCISAAYVGAPHHRDRIWIIAYPRSKGLSGPVLEGHSLSFAARTQSAKFGDLVVSCGGWWAGHRPDLRMGDGLPPGSHRLKQLGNSCIPEIVEKIASAIMATELLLE